MDVEGFVDSIPEFQSLPYVEQIKLFAWFLHRHCSRENFSGGDIGKCYRDCCLSPPSSVSPFLSSLHNRKPPILIKRGSSYVLEKTVRDSLDNKYGKRESEINVDRLLTSLPPLIPSEVERAYLEEALICFRNRAFRASIVMTWNLAFDYLCCLVLAKHLPAFNAQLPRSFARAEIDKITTRDDFTALKEHQILQVCKSSNIISQNVFKILKEKLDRRNMAAHPSAISISQPTAEEFIKDLVENVVLKLR